MVYPGLEITNLLRVSYKKMKKKTKQE